MKSKRSAKSFEQLVKYAISSVSIDTSRRFSAKARRYMLIYHHHRLSSNKIIEVSEDSQWSHEKIEKMNKVYRSHRDVNVIDGIFIEQVQQDCIGIKSEGGNIEIKIICKPNDEYATAII